MRWARGRSSERTRCNRDRYHRDRPKQFAAARAANFGTFELADGCRFGNPTL
jgi:hypothetical protein